MKVSINAQLDYVMGYLKYGHLEGELNIPDEDIDFFKENPKKYLKDNELLDCLELVVDDYRVEDYGEICKVSYQKINQ